MAAAFPMEYVPYICLWCSARLEGFLIQHFGVSAAFPLTFCLVLGLSSADLLYLLNFLNRIKQLNQVNPTKVILT